MGPIALFDKSFLQSLSLDESVWFDHFFLANVCPIFYAETQSDLAKEDCKSITPEDLVSRIAAKFPDSSGSPNVYHVTMCTANLLGEEVPLRPQIVLPSGCRREVSGHLVAVLPESAEAKAFIRWTQGLYEEDEKQAATECRKSRFGHETAKVITLLKDARAYEDTPCSRMTDVRDAVDGVLSRLKPEQQLCLALLLLDIPENEFEKIMARFLEQGGPDLRVFSPYAAFAFRIELMYHIGVEKSRMSVVQRMDMTYLLYLPFCQFFVSADWIHKDCAPLFLREDQDFIWGSDLKNALKSLNERYAALPEDEKNKSIHEIAPFPPPEGGNLVTQLWDKHWPTWRAPREAQQPDAIVEGTWWQQRVPAIKKILESGGDSLQPDLPVDAIARKRRVRTRKGSWWQVPEAFRKKTH
jgi:hypothetical protein